MVVSVYPPSRGGLSEFDTTFALQQDYWNDYSFQTLYHLYYRDPREPSSPMLVGAVKILKKAQTAADTIQIQQEFKNLQPEFCSVGMSLGHFE